MRCKCGNEIHNVPEHLRDLADWQCQQCSNSAPRQRTIGKTEVREYRSEDVERREEAA